MSAAAEKKEEAHGSAPAGGGGGNKLVLILTLVNMVATLGMLGVLVVSFKKESAAPRVEDIASNDHGGDHGGGGEGGGHGEAKGEHGGGKKKAPASAGKMVNLDQFTVNLTAPGSATPKYVRVNISLEMPTDDAEQEVALKMPQVRNTIIDLFNSKRPTDLATSEGRDFLKEEIRNALNGFLVSGKVRGVFFTNFAVTS